MTFKILSLDGGGIRGVLSAILLKQVEDTIREKKGQKLHEYFDLVAGTSTGSILTGGIACQMDAHDMIDIYKTDGTDIFLESIRKQRKWRKLSQAFGSDVLYPHEEGERGLAKVLQQKLVHKTLHRTPKMCEIVQPNILIPAYDVYSRNTTWFCNNHADPGKGLDSNAETWYDNIELWKICTASASAPTFFPPYELPYNADQTLPHIDGGVSCNNPSLVAIAHALLTHKKNGLQLSDIAVLSIGTGNTSRPYEYQDIKEWGALGWIKNLPNIFMNPHAKNSEDICSQILESAGEDHLRLNFDLNEQFKGEPEPGRLRQLLDKPYNKYIAEMKNQQKEVSEDIDNPENCPILIEAAECYLDCGKTYYKEGWVPVREATQQFIESH
ncbi:patatin-like phospholipase family protein [Phormidium pseudopriestleyi FRX01]|uniref:Patatin-like phospholipase family protein n=1 Tax=Phormidium pseudopriestleyi FRX01 TaxID=1759528 RepID=A0ABS3FLV6_9CYAN|nr:patatin-like phospholipase family protein [Phormidium pseudopriestleyi]MBO0348094.1 patatin-like phospholipase family protein [Phormidium pseudopriestleyi FRX01]